MPLTQRRNNNNSARAAAMEAVAAGAPTRKKRVQQQVEAFLTSWDHAPQHLRDNPFIRQGYRAGHSFTDAVRSAFKLHNESGNIWTHLVGFIIFVLLTVTTIRLRPAPLRLGAEALSALEGRLSFHGSKSTLYDVLATAEAWERSVVRLGGDVVAPLEARLRTIGKHNLHDLADLFSSSASELGGNIEAFGSSLGSSARGVGAKLRAAGASASAELAHVEARISRASADALRDLEINLHRALAAVIDAKWPVSRWPMHVFTAGAMACLLTSAVCHLFGCCAAHVSSIMWRFDYAGIATLIVASFFPPVYYAFLCNPVARVVYLGATAALGLSAMAVTLLQRFQDPRWHAYRAGLFVGLGLWGAVPLVHAWRMHASAAEFVAAMHLDLAMGAIYLIGAAIYAARVPERWKPGAFDVAFHSHQLFHVAVVIAAMLHYKASRLLMHWRDTTGGCGLSAI
jgi:adiponectin receptor